MVTVLKKYFSKADVTTVLFWAVALGCVYFLALPLVELGTSHLRIVEAFNIDEGEFLWPLSEAYSRGDFNIGRYDYGLWYYNIGLTLVYFVGLFRDVGDQQIIQIMRLESMGFLVGSAWLFYKMGRANFHKIASLGLALSVLLTSVTLLNYGTMLHPDTCQLFFIVWSIFLMQHFISDKKVYWIMAASASAGLAFSTKYAGIALMPIVSGLLFVYGKLLFMGVSQKAKLIVLGLISLVWAAVLDVSWISSQITQEAEVVATMLLLVQIGRVIFIGLLCFSLLGLFQFLKALEAKITILGSILLSQVLALTVFMGAFFLSSPQAAYKLNFLNGFIYVTNLHKDGHWFRDDRGLLGWFDILQEEHVLGTFWIGLSLLGMLAFLWVKRRKKDQINGLLPLVWILVFLGVIVLRVKSKFPHYLIPIIPFLIFYAWGFINDLIGTFARRISIKRRWLLIPIMGISFFISANNAHSYKNDRVEQFKNSDALKAGEWIAHHVQKGDFVLADKYSYVPALKDLSHVTVFGIVVDHLTEYDPDWLMIHPLVYDRFLDISKREGYLYGEDVFDERNWIYSQLLANRFEGYKQVYAVGRVKVFKRNKKSAPDFSRALP